MARTYVATRAHAREAPCGARYYPAPFDFVPVIPGCAPPPWVAAELAVLKSGWQSYADHCLTHDPVETDPPPRPLFDARCTVSTNPDCRCWYCSTVETAT